MCSDLQNDDLLTPLQSLHVSSCAEVKPCQLRRTPQEFILAEQHQIHQAQSQPPAKPLIKYICKVTLESSYTCEGRVYCDTSLVSIVTQDSKPTCLHNSIWEHKCLSPKITTMVSAKD